MATATLLGYAPVVDVDISNNEINFADATDYGHRVQVDIDRAALNGFLGWARNMGSATPVGAVVAGGREGFKTALVAALKAGYVDIDGVSGGLHFSTAVLQTNTDERIQDGGATSANDLVMAYVMNKLYGSSAYATANSILNLADAHGMLTSEEMAEAICLSLEDEENAGAVDAMFRDLLAADTARFFDASGNQIPGLFETNSDASGSGTWLLIEDDKIEIKCKLTFAARVSRRGVAGGEVDITNPEDPQGNNQQTVIPAGHEFYIRLQLIASA
jgi:hypothetical protein